MTSKNQENIDEPRRYIVGDGYAYYTGPPKNPGCFHDAGSVLTLTQAQIEKHKQAHKLRPCEKLMLRCDNCGTEFSTASLKPAYAYCPNKDCEGRGGEILGPDFTPSKLEAETAESTPAKAPEENRAANTPPEGTGETQADAAQEPAETVTVPPKPGKVKAKASLKGRKGKKK